MVSREIGGMDRALLKVKETIDGIYDFFGSITNFHREMDIDEAAKFYTEKLDAYMMSAKTRAQDALIAGQLTFQYVDEQVFLIKLDLYYPNPDGQWMQESSQTTRKLKYLRPEAAAELREKKEISFEIDPPAETEEAPAPAEARTPAPSAPPAIAAPAETPAAEESPAPAPSAPPVIAEVPAAAEPPPAPAERDADR